MGIDERALSQSLRQLLETVGGPMYSLAHQLGLVVGAAAELLGADCVGVLLLDESDRVRNVAASEPAAAALESAQERLQLGPGVDVMRSRQAVAVADLAEHPRYRLLWDEMADTGVRGVLSVPVSVRGEVVGNLNAVTSRIHEWNEDELRAGEAYAGLVGQLLAAASRVAGRPEERPDERQPGAAAPGAEGAQWRTSRSTRRR